MLNSQHTVILIEILKDIYSDPELRTILGFKGGTAAMLFYDLPRLSVDLDFDLLDSEKKAVVLQKMKIILEQHAVIRQALEKRYTLFFLISYEKGEHTIKVEISKRPTISGFQAKSYLGIPMLVMRQEDMVANKLAAFLTRKKTAMRDVFDLWFFLKNKWSINPAVVAEKTNMSLSQSLEQAKQDVSNLKKSHFLQGLGELLDEKQKDWVRSKLAEEVTFYLQLYREVEKKP